MRLLLVEDDSLLAENLCRQLIKENFTVDVVGTSEGAKQLAKQEDYRIIILDLGLPDGSGLTLLKGWRQCKLSVPVLILTARNNWQDKVMGLKAGADDYLTKPFQFEELVARLNALIRRTEGRIESRLVAGEFELDENRQYLHLSNGAEFSLTGTEFRLLRCLMSRPGQIFSKEQLLEQLYNLEDSPTHNTIEAYIKRLRKLIGANAILTRRGQGYLLNASVKS